MLIYEKGSARHWRNWRVIFCKTDGWSSLYSWLVGVARQWNSQLKAGDVHALCSDPAAMDGPDYIAVCPDETGIPGALKGDNLLDRQRPGCVEGQVKTDSVHGNVMESDVNFLPVRTDEYAFAHLTVAGL